MSLFRGSYSVLNGIALQPVPSLSSLLLSGIIILNGSIVYVRFPLTGFPFLVQPYRWCPSIDLYRGTHLSRRSNDDMNHYYCMQYEPEYPCTQVIYVLVVLCTRDLNRNMHALCATVVSAKHTTIKDCFPAKMIYKINCLMKINNKFTATVWVISLN